MPGELAKIAVVIGPEHASTPTLSGVVEGGGKATEGSNQLITVKFPSNKLREEMPELITRSLRSNPNLDAIEADVLYFHTHPGCAGPLSGPDEDVLRTAQSIFTREFPYVSFRFLMVAAAKLDVQGDLLFVQELKSPATATLSQLLKR